MIAISIRLLGEQQDRLIDGIEVDNQILYMDLKKRIESVTQIPPHFQQIELRGVRLPFVERPIQDVKFGEEIVVKHAHLDHWRAYVNCVDEFKDAHDNEMRKMAAADAQRTYDMLCASSFFAAYADFHIAVIEHHKPITKYLEKRNRIRNAAKNFFALSMFKGQNPVVEFEETNDGTRPAVICKVTVNSITHKYRIKTNHNAGESGPANRWHLDLRELYCYKLLESIGVGPRILFIPDLIASTTILYIASEWLADFQSFNSIQQVNATEVSDAIVRIHFLTVIFSLGDMHEENFGINARSDPIILDFMMSDRGDPKHKFLHEDNWIRSIQARDILRDCDPSTRLLIAKNAIRKWNLMDKLGQVLALIDKEKQDFWDFGRETLDFDKTTRDLEEFVERVRSNIEVLTGE